MVSNGPGKMSGGCPSVRLPCRSLFSGTPRTSCFLIWSDLTSRLSSYLSLTLMTPITAYNYWPTYTTYIYYLFPVWLQKPWIWTSLISKHKMGTSSVSHINLIRHPQVKTVNFRPYKAHKVFKQWSQPLLDLLLVIKNKAK